MSTLKAYRSTRNGDILETPQEAVSRVFNRTIQVTNLITHEVYDNCDIGQHPDFNRYHYCKRYVDSSENGTMSLELIGLFIVWFDEDQLGFQLRNFDEYKVILTDFLTFKNKTK